MDFSWAMDILCGFLLFAGIYLGFKRGMLIGLYNLIAILIVTIFVVHNYINFTEFMRKKIPAVPPLYGDFLSFFVLLVVSLIIVWLFRGVLLFFVSTEEMGKPEKAFGAVLGFFSGLVVTSLWMLALYLSPWQNMESSISEGSLTRRLVFVPSYIYNIAVDYIIRPIDEDFSANTAVYNSGRQDISEKKKDIVKKKKMH